MTFRSDHPGGAHFCLCDGAVTFVNDSIDFALYQAMSTRDGEEALTGSLQ
jgi:prepilin-type processing-associated H-X9-DG protein